MGSGSGIWLSEISSKVQVFRKTRASRVRFGTDFIKKKDSSSENVYRKTAILDFAAGKIFEFPEAEFEMFAFLNLNVY